MPQLISDGVKESLVLQLGQELANSSFYMRIAAFLQSKNLKNLAKHFFHQVLEERNHADIIYNLLTDLGEDFLIPEIPEANIVFSSFLELAEQYLNKEIETTNSLRDIMEMAADSGEGGCSIVQVKMISMIEKQQAEMEESTSLVDTAKLLPEWWQVALYDASLKSEG